MKNLLSKSLLCGVLATSFLIINCQKAPNRGLKAEVLAKTAAKVGDCTPAAVTAITARSTAVEDLKKAIAAKPTDADGKQKLDASMKDVTDKTKTVIDEITKIKVGKDNADGCKVADPDPKKAPVQYDIAVFTSENSKLASAVKDITGTATPSLDPASTALANGDEISISADLATMMTSGEGCISDGKILTTECEKVSADTKVTSCGVTLADDKAVDADSKAKVISISTAVVDDTTKRSSSSLALSIGDRALSIDCNLADGGKAEVEITKALGALVTKSAAVVGPAAPAVGSDDSTPPPPPPASGDGTVTASGDGTTGAAQDAALSSRASEALTLLDSKLGN